MGTNNHSFSSIKTMSLWALRCSSSMGRIPLHRSLSQRVQFRMCSNLQKQQVMARDGIPPHLIRKGRRKIPEPYLKILKQVPPRHKDYFGQGIIAFIFLFTFVVNGAYMWQAYTLKDMLKAQGVIEGSTDERWTNISTY